MFAVEIDYLVRKEQYKDLRHEIARQQLIQTAALRRSSNGEWFRGTAGRIGAQMVKWGSKLQHYGRYQHQTLPQ
jgi:hypothetical protein